jgi:putative ABC transport system substrate-binding protein
VKRREFIAALGGAAAWPVVAQAQQAERLRRIGILFDYREGDPEGQTAIAAFREELSKLGWVDARGIVLDIVSGAAEADSLRTYARGAASSMM